MYDRWEKNFPKVIMLSAEEDDRLQKYCFEEKLIDKFILKPAHNSVLEEEINKLLEI